MTGALASPGGDALPSGDGTAPSARNSGARRVLTTIGAIAPALVLIGAVVTKWGWVSDRTGLVTVDDGEAPVQFNTALGFVLAAVGVLAQRVSRRRVVPWVTGVSLLVLGLATLGQYVFRTSIGIDEVFVEHTVTTRTPFLGRMAPSTAFGFVLVGVALVRPRLRSALGWAVGLLVALVLLDRIAGGVGRDVTPFTAMAPQTQVMLALISVALVTAPSRDGESAAAIDSPRRLHVATACLLTLLLMSWQLLEREQWKERDGEVQLALVTLEGNLEEKLLERGNALWRMADRWALYGGTDRAQWEHEAQRFLRDYPNVGTVVVVDPDLTVRWQETRDGNASLEGGSLAVDDQRIETFRTALELEQPRLMPFLGLQVGTRGTAYTVPIFENGVHAGFLNASINAEDILPGIRGEFFAGFGQALLDDDGVQSGSMPAPDDLGALLVHERRIDAFGQDWRLAIWPTDAYLRRQVSQLPFFVLAFGLFAGTLSLSLFRSNQRQISQREQAQGEQRIAIERFHYVARATSDVIWDWDLVNDTLWWSDGMETEFGWSPGDVARTSEWTGTRIHPDERDAVLTSILEAIGEDGGDDWEATYRFLHADGEYRYVIDQGFVIRDDAGRAVRMVGGIQDITEQREAAERLASAERLDALGQLTGGVAHDFNNLLTVIIGNAQLIEEEAGDSDRLRQLGTTTLAAANRGADLTRRLLAFARRQPLEPKLVDVNSMLSRTEELLRRALEEHIDIRLALTEMSFIVEVDQGQLESAVLNIALNARDAMPDGGRLTIETAATSLDDSYAETDAEGKAGSYVSISISDTGHGMSPDVVSRAFEPFFTTKPSGQGTGLGLSTVLGFVKQSGGHMKIYSELGHGTTVRIYLPVVDSPLTERPVERRRSQLGGEERILLVEDDELVRGHVEAMLRRLGYTVTSAASGSEALDVLDRSPDIDLLFTDVIMPGQFAGPELAEQALIRQPQLRVLFTSGYTQNALIHQGRLDEGVQLLSKPYGAEELANKLRDVLES